MGTEIVKYLCAIVAIYTTLLYVSNLFVSLNTNPYKLMDDGGIKDDSKLHAKFRLILGIIMSLTWGVLIVF